MNYSCENCTNYKNGFCELYSCHGLRQPKIGCTFFVSKCSKTEKFFYFLFDLMKILIIAIFIAAILYCGFNIQYSWTKSSLEDLTGKEVKPSTVIWTMFQTGNNK